MSFRYYNPVQAGGMLVYEGSRRQRGGMIYSGSQRQRGGNLVGTLQRVLLPLARKAAPSLMKAGKDIARRGLKVGVGAITDKLRNQNTSLKSSIKKRATQAADKAITDYLGEADQPDIPFLSQEGDGLRRRRPIKRKTINKMKPKRLGGKKKKCQFKDIYSRK